MFPKSRRALGSWFKVSIKSVLEDSPFEVDEDLSEGRVREMRKVTSLTEVSKARRRLPWRR